MCGYPPKPCQPQGSRESFLHKNSPKLLPGIRGLVSDSGFGQTEPFPSQIVPARISAWKTQYCVGMQSSESCKTATAGTNEQTAQCSVSRRGKDKGVPRGARWGGEEASLLELEDQKEWESRVWNGLFFFFFFNHVGRMGCQCILIRFLGAFTIAHYSSPENTSKEILNAVISNNLVRVSFSPGRTGSFVPS